MESGAMARSIRLEFEGAFYHGIALCNRREAIFSSDEDRVGSSSEQSRAETAKGRSLCPKGIGGSRKQSSGQ